MALTQEQLTKIQNWINRPNYIYSCPVCRGRNFTVGSEIIVAPAIISGNISIGGQTIPMIQVVCNTCAHVSFFASVPILGNP